MSAQVALRQGSAGNPSCRWYVVRNLPKDGRGRMFAMRQLRSIAAHGGYAVRNRGGQVPPVTGQTSGSLGAPSRLRMNFSVNGFRGLSHLPTTNTLTATAPA